MLGEILGRNAGLTWTELLFVLFLPPRPLARASPRLLCSDPFGEPMGFKLGLVKEEPVAVTGALVGPILGVFRADIVGVVSSSCASEVRNGVKAGRFEDVLEVSGEVMVSIVCSSCASSNNVCSFSVEPVGLLAALRILINDDGVAGLSSVAGNGAECGPDEAAAIWGDLLAEADLGVAGGGIKTSDSGSGDMDSPSELSRLREVGPLLLVCCLIWRELLAFSASSMIPFTLLGGMLVLDSCFFLDCGFIEGDCRTAR